LFAKRRTGTEKRIQLFLYIISTTNLAQDTRLKKSTCLAVSGINTSYLLGRGVHPPRNQLLAFRRPFYHFLSRQSLLQQFFKHAALLLLKIQVVLAVK
jgi:hypothetical protein